MQYGFDGSRLFTSLTDVSETDEGSRRSVTGLIYSSNESSESNENGDKKMIKIQLYTKEGCTLCDKVTDVLRSIRESHPHQLEAVDITDPDKTEFFDKYKWDIPVLHVNNLYWTKHRLDADDAKEFLDQVKSFQEEGKEDKIPLPQKGEPNAGEMERRQLERQQKREIEQKEKESKTESGGNWFD